jgi:N6-adenosine-specific RNA methylase IME4
MTIELKELKQMLPADLLLEFVENVDRKDLNLTELVALKQRLTPLVAAAASERQREGGRMKASGKLPPASKVKTRDVLSKLLGRSPHTLDRAEAVLDAAASDPGRFAHLAEEMNRTGKADGVFKKLLRAQDEARVSALQSVVGKYRTLVFDPPWVTGGGRGFSYAIMSQEDLLKLPVPSWADEEGCHIYTWVTNGQINNGFALLSHWGFEYKTLLTWAKPSFGMGTYFRLQTEHVLFGVRGNLGKREAAGSISNFFEAPVGAHSEKPEMFYELVRKASYPPYGEAFQRKARDGFTNLFEVSAAVAA